MKLFKNRKGQLTMLLSAAIMIVILAITFGLGGKIIADVGAGAAANSALLNATNSGGKTINDMSAYLPTVGIVIIIACILGILITYLYKRFAGGE